MLEQGRLPVGERDNTMMLLGDAKKVTENVVKAM
jgi:NAD/NADP transhydrogenase beta subunit